MFPQPTTPPVLKSVSPSQIKQFDPDSEGGCNRKHYLNKRCGVPMPQSPAQALGEKVHTEVENFLLHGTPPTHESVAHILERPGFPSRGGELLVEYPKNYATGIKAAGVQVKMRMDLVDPREALAGTGPLKVWDWKTSKNFSWAAKPNELLDDPQCLKYTYWAATRYPTATEFVFLHGYISTAHDYDRSAQPDSRIVATPKISRDDVIHRYTTIIEPKVERMKEVFARASVADVEPNWDACDAYGGCPYQEICGKRPLSAVNTDLETPPPTEKEMNEANDFIAARKAALAKKDAPAGTLQAYVQDADGKFKRDPTQDIKVRATGINPPDASPLPAVTPYVPPPAELVAEAAAVVNTVVAPADSIAGALKLLEQGIEALRAALAIKAA